jgi:sugar phosphate isomerase/epimerase
MFAISTEKLGIDNSPECLALVAKTGFEGVMLPHSANPDAPDFHPAAAKAAGLQVVCVHASYQLTDDLLQISQAGESALRYYLRCIADCAACGCPVMAMHPPYAPVNEIALVRFAALAAEGERRGVRVALENLRQQCELDNIGTILAAVDSPHLGFCFDTGHNNAGYDFAPRDLLANWGSRLLALHLHDNHNKSAGDEHRLPFDGTVAWAQVIRGIAAAPRPVWLLLEVTALGYETQPLEAFLRTAYARAVRLADMLSEYL